MQKSKQKGKKRKFESTIGALPLAKSVLKLLQDIVF